MRKTLVMALVCLFAAVGATEAKSLVINLQNGTKAYYLLGGDTNPMMRFVDGKVMMDADEYSIGDIKNFYISETDAPNSIEGILTENDVQFRANTLVINAGDAKGVKVYGANGAQVETDVQQHGDIVTVDLNALRSGTYIVYVSGSSFKVMKK